MDRRDVLGHDRVPGSTGQRGDQMGAGPPGMRRHRDEPSCIVRTQRHRQDLTAVIGRVPATPGDRGVLADGGPTQDEISAAQATLVTAQLNLAQAKHNLAKTELVAPYDGVISSVSAKVGEISGSTAMVITDTSELAADLKVDEAEIGKVQVGQPVTMTLDALSGVTLTGKVQYIADTADTSSSVITYVVHVVLDPVKATVKPGMSVNATLAVKDLKNVLRVPNDYLKTNRALDQATVNLVGVDGSITTIPIQVGVQGTDYTEITGGLNEGETITNATSAAAASKNG